jgi:hypothetical protein
MPNMLTTYVAWLLAANWLIATAVILIRLWMS